MSEVLTERHGRVLVITINRPEVRNAVNQAVAQGIAGALDELDADSGLTAAVLTGAGRGFCAGMDLAAFLDGERPSVPGRGFAGIVEHPPAKPVVAAVEGFAVAGGLEIALACDLIAAGKGARLGLPEVRRGLLAGGGGLLRLPRRLPLNVAMEWALTGELVTAEELRGVGLLNRITEDGQALDAALELAERVAQNAPLAVAATKRIMSESPWWAPDEAFDRQREIYEPIRSSEDAAEGARAFKEKRTPRWRGR